MELAVAVGQAGATGPRRFKNTHRVDLGAAARIVSCLCKLSNGHYPPPLRAPPLALQEQLASLAWPQHSLALQHLRDHAQAARLSPPTLFAAAAQPRPPWASRRRARKLVLVGSVHPSSRSRRSQKSKVESLGLRFFSRGACGWSLVDQRLARVNHFREKPIFREKPGVPVPGPGPVPAPVPGPVPAPVL